MPRGGRRYCRECLRGCQLAFVMWSSRREVLESEVFGDVNQSVVDFFVQERNAVLID